MPDTFTGGIRVKDKLLLKHRYKDAADSVMQYPVLNVPFSYASLLRVVNEEAGIWVVPIRSPYQRVMEVEYAGLEIFREGKHVALAGLVSLEFAPCRKEVFFRDDVRV